MRAHEKMLLNSKLIKAAPYYRHYGDGEGCALGMMEGDQPEYLAEVLYPWLLDPVDKPCDCPLEWAFARGYGTGTGVHAITHLFNEHVCHGLLFGNVPARDTWTMERLADYIKSIDPTVDDEEILCEEDNVHEYQKA